MARLLPLVFARNEETGQPFQGGTVVLVLSEDPSGRVTSAVQAIWQELERTPELHLTTEEAVERLGVDAAEVEDILAAFVTAGVLRRLEGGVYVRCARTDG